MANFNPYYQWLGIPPAEQPANHYRLLGITKFEPDPSVIENAADQRVLLIRNVASGPHATLAQQLLNEVSAAKLTLINPERKAQYDQVLRQSTSRPTIGEMPVRSPAASGITASDAAEDMAEDSVVLSTSKLDGSATRRARRLKSNSRKKPAAMTYVIGAALVMLIVAMVIVLRDFAGTSVADSDDGPSASIRLKSITDQDVEVGKQLVVRAKVKTKGDVSKKIKYKLEPGSPPSATIDESSGEIRWTPVSRDGGRPHSIRVRVDAGKLSDAMRFVVNVPKPNYPPRVGKLVDRRAEVGRPVTLQVRASDGRNGGPLTFRVASNLPGARIGAQTGEFRWQPTADYSGKSVAVRIGVADDEGAEGFTTFNIHVAKSNVVEDNPSLSLISKVDVERDVVSGKTWRLLGDALVVAKESASRLILTETPRWPQYILASNIQVTGRTLAAGLLANDRQILAVLGNSKETSGIRAKDGSLVGALKLESGTPLTTGQETEVKYIVYQDGVLVTCDGEPAIAWRGDWAELADPGPQWRVPTKDALFIGADQSDCRWVALRFEPVKDDVLQQTLAKIPAESVKGTMPDEAAIAKAQALAERAFASQINSSRSPTELKETLGKVMAAMKGEKVSDAEKYVLAKMAIDIAALVGETQTAVSLIDTMGSDFGTDTAQQYAAALERMSESRHNAGSDAQSAIASSAASLLPKLIDREEFLAAFKIANLALKTARKGRNADVTKRVVDQKQDILALGRMHKLVVEARKRLEVDPENAAANTIVGRWESFVKGRWPIGLQQLAKGDQTMLKEIASRDLAEPGDTAAQYQLALDWFRLGQKAQGRMQQEITSRAAFWYRIAEPKMSALQREAVPDDFRDAISTPTEVVSESDPGSTTKPQLDADNAPTDAAGDDKNAQYLVGFVATSRAFDEKIYCVASLQPVYRVANGKHVTGRVYGVPGEFSRVIVAKKGYAVGAIDVRVGAALNGFSLTFYRVTPTGLNAKTAYRSPWYCNNTGGSSRRIDGGGRRIASATATVRHKHVQNIAIVPANP
ncbi:MAG: hypothetical protein MI757_04925 [Pirellulales bacterium]|nr:hypothetical protein [Pirellulales bacterium]